MAHEINLSIPSRAPQHALHNLRPPSPRPSPNSSFVTSPRAAPTKELVTGSAMRILPRAEKQRRESSGDKKKRRSPRSVQPMDVAEGPLWRY